MTESPIPNPFWRVYCLRQIFFCKMMHPNEFNCIKLINLPPTYYWVWFRHLQLSNLGSLQGICDDWHPCLKPFLEGFLPESRFCEMMHPTTRVANDPRTSWRGGDNFESPECICDDWNPCPEPLLEGFLFFVKWHTLIGSTALRDNYFITNLLLGMIYAVSADFRNFRNKALWYSASPSSNDIVQGEGWGGGVQKWSKSDYIRKGQPLREKCVQKWSK